jgi:hypothetical protein
MAMPLCGSGQPIIATRHATITVAQTNKVQATKVSGTAVRPTLPFDTTVSKASLTNCPISFVCLGVYPQLERCKSIHCHRLGASLQPGDSLRRVFSGQSVASSPFALKLTPTMSSPPRSPANDSVGSYGSPGAEEQAGVDDTVTVSDVMRRQARAREDASEDQDSHQYSGTSSPSPPPADVPPFDWEDFEARYEKALQEADEEHKGIIKEAEALAKVRSHGSHSSSHISFVNTRAAVLQGMGICGFSTR